MPQFGDINYGKWGLQKLEIRETLLHLITLNEEMDKMLKDRIIRIDKAIEYIEQNCIDDEYYINLTRKEKEIIKVLDILKGSDNDGKTNL